MNSRRMPITVTHAQSYFSDRIQIPPTFDFFLQRAHRERQPFAFAYVQMFKKLNPLLKFALILSINKLTY